jgi:hypothetical protein
MAITQISKIQIRRDKAIVGTGAPQLASGELAWTIDTQELHIGNGSIAEGAPNIGNTKIITERDLMLEFNLISSQYTYKQNDVSFEGPISRPLQDHLDEHVSITAFGVYASAADVYYEFQRAIDRLYLNISATAYNTPVRRVILSIPPGTYNISSTLNIPSYVTLVGAGIDKTIINYNGNSSIMQFVNDTSTDNTPASISSTLGVNQPRNITIKDLTLNASNTAANGLTLNCVKDSLFENIKIAAMWRADLTINSNSTGIKLNSKITADNSLVKSENNLFKNIHITGFSYGIYSDDNIDNNIFENGSIGDTNSVNIGYGVMLGLLSDQSANPTNTKIINYSFYYNKFNAVYVKQGTNNVVLNCSMSNVGAAQYPQIYFDVPTNVVDNLLSTRFDTLSDVTSQDTYIPEVSGSTVYNTKRTYSATLMYNTTITDIVRLPLASNELGVITGFALYTIVYSYSNTTYKRFGKLVISASANGTIQLSDEYDFIGSEVNNTALEFSASLVNNTIVLSYTNSLLTDSGTFAYTYSVQM